HLAASRCAARPPPHPLAHLLGRLCRTGGCRQTRRRPQQWDRAGNTAAGVRGSAFAGLILRHHERRCPLLLEEPAKQASRRMRPGNRCPGLMVLKAMQSIVLKQHSLSAPFADGPAAAQPAPRVLTVFSYPVTFEALFRSDPARCTAKEPFLLAC